MALPLSYNIRNVRVRWQVTLLAISGIALVVAVLAVLLSMSAGFQMALRATGRPDNALIVQRGSASELLLRLRLRVVRLVRQPSSRPSSLPINCALRATERVPTARSAAAVETSL